VSCLLSEEAEIKESHVCIGVPEFSLCSPVEDFKVCTVGSGLQICLWELKLFFNT